MSIEQIYSSQINASCTGAGLQVDEVTSRPVPVSKYASECECHRMKWQRSASSTLRADLQVPISWQFRFVSCVRHCGEHARNWNHTLCKCCKTYCILTLAKSAPRVAYARHHQRILMCKASDKHILSTLSSKYRSCSESLQSGPL